MAANAERDHSILSIGKQCHHRTCNLVDFLPFKCQHCNESYCGDHFRPQAHQCEHYDETKHNRIAPPCPFCKVPLAIPAGVDPNIPMERHFNTDCPVLVGKSAKSSTPRCSRPNCGKVLFAPIPCNQCKKQFCPNHRFPDDHKCPSAAPSKASTPSGGASTPHSRPAATSAAAMAAIKRAMNNTASASAAQKKPQPSPSKPTVAPPKLPASTSVNSAVASTSTRSTNPFSATDRAISPRTLSSNANTTTSMIDDINISPSPTNPTTSLFFKPYVPRPIFATA